MTAIQRFALHGTIMNPHSSGPYVRHEDHLAAMQGRCLAQIEEPAQPVADVREAFARRYSSDPADPMCAADLAIYSAGWHDARAGAAPAAVAPHITEPYTLAEIKAKIARHDYNAEHLLQHAMLLLEPAAVAGPADVRDALREASSVISSINHGRAHELTVNDEKVFWQRQEWVDWALREVLPRIDAALAAPAQEAPALEAPAAEAIAQAITNNFRDAGWSMPSIDSARVLEAVKSALGTAAAPQAPAAPSASTIPDAAYCALQYVERALTAIANREELADGAIERMDNIGKASKRAKAALTRLQAVAHHFDAAAPAAPAVDAETIHLQDLKNALAECKELRQQVRLMDEQQAGTVWRWQADGQDQLASMGNRMGVLIYACDLRALLAGAAPAVEASEPALPSWWPDFIQCVAELPDRNSPDDEPDAMIATAEELGACALVAQAKEGGETV